MSKNGIVHNYYNYQDLYPKQPDYNPGCGINQVYKTIPRQGVEWETTAVGPATIKHLYTGVPNYYPIRKITRPKNTLYGHDFSQFQKVPGGYKRLSYQYKVYPFTHRHSREIRNYSDELLPYMNNEEWTKYPVKKSQSLDSYGFKN